MPSFQISVGVRTSDIHFKDKINLFFHFCYILLYDIYYNYVVMKCPFQGFSKKLSKVMWLLNILVSLINSVKRSIFKIFKSKTLKNNPLKMKIAEL